MDYTRVLPRDFFNESKLLKCWGQLALIIHDGCDWPLVIEHDTGHGEGFIALQRESDGFLCLANVELFYAPSGDTTAEDSICIEIGTRYNSKDSYPMYFEDGTGDGGEVFTDDGRFHPEFVEYLETIRKATR